MLKFVDRYGVNFYSQFREDGVLDEILKRIGMNHGVSVEFGAPTKEYCSNTYNLDNLWQKYFFDIDPSDSEVIKKEITTDNVNDLPKCNVLSIDTDGPCYNLWKAYKGNPEVVIIEINSDYPPGAFLIHGIHHLKGTTYTPMVQLGISKGYFLVCHTGNCIFVLNKYRDLFPEIIGDGLSNYEQYFNTSHL